MLSTSGTILLSLLLLGANPAVKWMGQDGHDLVGPSAEAKPSDVQDIHLVFGNLPPHEIVLLRVLGFGGDAWTFPRQGGCWAAAIERKPNASTADVFIEPAQTEKGRSFDVELRLDDGTRAIFSFKGGKADPNLRMPGAAVVAKWVGQVRRDEAGPDLGVGPDGLQDARISLAKLSPKIKVEAVDLDGAGGLHWTSGPNPKARTNAELVRDEKDPSHADLFFQPDRDLAGKVLSLTISYENGKSDKATVTAGKTDPKLAMPRQPLPKIAPIALKAEWHGQDGSQEAGRGTVHVTLLGLPGRGLAAIVLSDAVRGNWQFRANDRVPLTREEETRPLFVRPGDGGKRAELFFAPYRDETGATMTVRLVFQDGTSAFAQFPGGRSDTALLAPSPAATSATARPGDNLQDLVNRFGTVRLSKGTYALAQPLVLKQPVTLVGEPGAVLQFTQGAGEPPWSAAVKIWSAGTTLEGFALRFTGPVRWDPQASWGPALIAATNEQDKLPSPQLPYLVFQGLDIEAPPAADPTKWERAPNLIRLVDVGGGVIARNTLRGGGIEMFSGPWRIEGNDYRGTPPGTSCDDVFTVHNGFDVLVRNNRAQPVGPSGKTWRFLVLTGQGAHDRIENNKVIGIGARDDDTIPWANEPEIILTESYTLLFEGKPAAVSADGRLLRIVRAYHRAPRTGDVVAVLAGAAAGQWRTIAQAIDGTTFLLDQPLAPGADVVSIATGFHHETYQRNTVEAPGGTRSGAIVLCGNHFGTRVLDNRIAGAGEACSIYAYPSEYPVVWGWTHVPMLDCEFRGNTFEDSERGAVFAVQHSKDIKRNRGRVYMTLTLADNTVRWTDAFLRHRRDQSLPPGVVLGVAGALDPAELRVAARANRLEAPAAASGSSPLVVGAALYNGQAIQGKTFALPGDERAASEKPKPR